jgi:pimeloyl-ACP methyl ester carboxylesterase
VGVPWTFQRCGASTSPDRRQRGHHDAFERLAARLARSIDADHVVLPGAGHAVQDTGRPFNTLLRKVWS